MKTIRCLLFALMLLAPCVCLAADEPGDTSAMFDAMANGLTSRLGTVSGWDNVTGAPQVIRGKRPCHDPCLGMDIVSLDPGEEVYIRRPDRSMLRILPVDTEDPQPEVFFGTGTGLEVRLDPLAAFSANGCAEASRIYRPHHPGQGVVRVAVPTDAARGTSFALFLSRNDPPALPEMYRHCLKLPLESVRLHEKGEPGLWGWYLLPARTPVRLDMEGEVRLQVEQHVLLDGTEPSRIIPYQIDVSLDGTPCAPLNFATTPLSSRLMYAQGHPRVLGRREQGFISIPEGKHALEMVTSRDMFVRVRVHDGHEFLVPDLNLTHWLDEPASSCDPVALRSRALSLAWDNGRRNGGVLAAAMMRRAADVRPDVPGLPAMSRLSEAMFTFYRDLFPDSPSRSRETCFFTPQLPDPRGSHNLVVQEDSWPTLLETLDQGRFFRLPEDGTLIRFGLPDRPAATTLRVAVLLPDTATSLEIDLGDREPVQCLVRPGGFLFADKEHSPGHTETPEASESPTTIVPAPDISQAGLLLVGQRFKGLDPTTLGGAFCRHPGQCVP